MTSGNPFAAIEQSQHTAQAHGKRLRHHKLGRRPTQLVERPRVGNVG